MKKTRLSVSLQPRDRELVDRLAWHRGVSSSQVIRELIETSREPLERLGNILELAGKAQAAFKGDLGSAVSGAAKEIDDLYQLALDHLEVVEKEVEKKSH
jgi:predicted DNA-binding protein